MKDALFLVVMLALCGAACRSESPPPPTDPEPPPAPPEEPPDVVLEPVEGTLATGRLAALRVRVVGSHGGLSEAAATLGELPGTVTELDDDRRHLLVLAPIAVDEERRELELRLQGTLADGSPFLASRRLPVEEAAYDESELRVSRHFVEPSKAQQARAAKERALIREVLTSASPERLWRGSFQRPTSTVETSPFGTRRLLNGKQQSRHLGWDLDGKTGDPILAAQRGRAVLVEDLFYSGGTLILDHGQGLYTLYFHMSGFDVKAGDLVEKGQLVGRVGKSGRVTGPHLHFAVKLADTYVDPKQVLELRLEDDPLATEPLAAAPVLEAEAVSP